MKSYAHPIGDTGEWCHEHKEAPDTATAAKPTATKTDTPPVPPVIIDPQLDDDFEEGKTPTATTDKTSTEEMLQWVAEKMKFKSMATAQNWCIKVCKIEAAKIDTDPAGVKAEIAALQGW